jgi:hypothetical protein
LRSLIEGGYNLPFLCYKLCFFIFNYVPKIEQIKTLCKINSFHKQSQHTFTTIILDF